MEKGMMRFWWTAALIALAVPAGVGSDESGAREYAAIDRHALLAPAAAEASIKTLAAYLTAPAQNEREKTRAIFRWITDRIAYDAELYLSGRADTADTSPQYVLRSRRSICDGYTNLFLALAHEAGLSAVKITGYTKGYSYAPGRRPSGENHSWNAVRIDGTWFLLDPTWGAGSISTRGFHKKFEPFFFFTPPEQLIWSHLPADPRWQLLEPPVSAEEFYERVLLKPAFFRNRMRLVSHTRAVIAAGDGLRLQLIVPAEVLLIFKLRQGDAELRSSLHRMERQGEMVTVEVRFPRPGNYTLAFYVKRESDSGNYEAALEYEAAAERGAGETAGWPKEGPDFGRLGLALESHLRPIIPAGSELTVTLRAPRGVFFMARLKEGEKPLRDSFLLLQRQGERLMIHCRFPRRGSYTLLVFARRDWEGGTFPEVLEYEIIARSGAGAEADFPRSSIFFTEFELGLDSHRELLVRAGREVTISVFAPEDVYLLPVLSQEGRQLAMDLVRVEREGGRVFLGVRFPVAGRYTVAIYAKRGEEGRQYVNVLEYEVEAGG